MAENMIPNLRSQSTSQNFEPAFLVGSATSKSADLDTMDRWSPEGQHSPQRLQCFFLALSVRADQSVKQPVFPWSFLARSFSSGDDCIVCCTVVVVLQHFWTCMTFWPN